MSKGLRGLFGFLTILPFGMQSIELVSQYFFLCPLVGLIVGAVSGAIGWALGIILPSTIVIGFLVLTAMQVLVGFHHLDGLLDFSDATMVRSEPAERLKIMHDQYTGAAAVGAGILVLAVTGLSFGYFSGVEILIVAMVAEITAKESMVFGAYIGRLPSYKGSGYYVVEAMKNKHQKLLVSVALSSVMVFLLTRSVIRTIVVFAAIVIVTTILSSYANKAFGGVTGDVLGATNEICRMVSLLILLATLP